MGLAETLAKLENSPKALAMRAAVAQRRFVRVLVAAEVVPELVRQLVAADDPIRTVVKNNPLPWDVQVQATRWAAGTSARELEVTLVHPTFAPVAEGAEPPLHSPTFGVREVSRVVSMEAGSLNIDLLQAINEARAAVADTPVTVGG